MPQKITDFVGNDQQIITMTAGETINANDLVIFAGDKLVYRARAALGPLLNRQTDTLTPISDVVVANTTSANSSNYFYGQQYALPLANGNTVVAYRDDTTNWTMVLIDPTGNVLARDIFLATTTSQLVPFIRRVDGSKFGIVWVLEGTGVYASVYWKIYNNDGSVNAATVTGTITNFLRQTSSSTVVYNDAMFTTDGYLVFCYSDSNAYPHLQSWTLTGTAKAFTTGSIVSVASVYPQVVQAYGITYLTFGSGTRYVYSWNHAGTNATNATAIDNFSNAGNNVGLTRQIGVTGGGFVVVADSYTTSNFYLKVYNAAGALRNGDNTANTNAGYPTIRELSDGTVLVIQPISTVGSFVTYRVAADGSSIISRSYNNTSFTASSSNIGNYRAILSSDRLVMFNDDNVGGNLQVNMIDFSPDWPAATATTGTAVSLSPSTYNFKTMSLQRNGFDVVAVGFNTSPTNATVYFNNKTIYMRKSSILGVAISSATVGNTFRVALKGTFQLPADQDFGAGFVSDQRTAAIDGPKALLSGRNVVLLGILPNA